MSRFIRTENRIYEVESEFLDNEGKWVGYNIVGNDMAIILRAQVINQADTIDELCDEFVGLVKSTSSDFIIMRVMAHSLKELKNSLKTKLNGKTYTSKFDIIYGAIWTDKGLIYVAKMNEKGDLELI